MSNDAQVGISTDPLSQCLVVWNLLTASVWWSAATPASCLAVDAKSGAFAVALPREPVRRSQLLQGKCQMVALLTQKQSRTAGLAPQETPTCGNMPAQEVRRALVDSWS